MAATNVTLIDWTDAQLHTGLAEAKHRMAVADSEFVQANRRWMESGSHSEAQACRRAKEKWAAACNQRDAITAEIARRTTS